MFLRPRLAVSWASLSSFTMVVAAGGRRRSSDDVRFDTRARPCDKKTHVSSAVLESGRVFPLHGMLYEVN